MFVDEVKLKLYAGNGGDGCTSFRREKYVPMGGPDGANGGKGSNIIFEVDKGLKTLIDLRYHKIVKGFKGENGKGSNKTGANAEDIIIKVPEGTTVIDEDTNLVVVDLIKDKERFIVCKGGDGGFGNRHFATHDNPVPNISEHGKPGEVRFVRVELKMLADVGLVGLPSVGKSTLLSQISAAKPKIAAYHFTTLSPNLGMVRLKNHESFVVADLPGLIEGASDGIGLGDQFLKHTMRTRLIAHILDMSSENVINDYEIINEELRKYSEKLYNKRKIVVANKMDLEESKINLEIFKQKYPNLEIIEISAMLNVGIDKLLERMSELLKEIDNNELYDKEELENEVIYNFTEEKPFTIHKEDDIWVIEGEVVETLYKITKFSIDEASDRFGRKLKKLGVDAELLRLGAKEGDEVSICGNIFEFKF